MIRVLPRPLLGLITIRMSKRRCRPQRGLDCCARRRQSKRQSPPKTRCKSLCKLDLYLRPQDLCLRAPLQRATAEPVEAGPTTTVDTKAYAKGVSR